MAEEDPTVVPSVTLYTDKHRVPFVVDAADAFAVSRYMWCIAGSGYPYTNIGDRSSRTVMPLHQFIRGRAPEGLEWDHIDRDPLNNRRGNLRAVTHAVNMSNRRCSSLVTDFP